MDYAGVQEKQPAVFSQKKADGISHRMLFHDRRTGSLTGILDVVSFDENQVILDTEMGLLTIKGKDLHLSRLTLEKGEVDLEGTVDSLAYASNEAYRKSGESLFARLFK